MVGRTGSSPRHQYGIKLNIRARAYRGPVAPIPVLCGSCGSLFFAQNLIGGAGTVTFENVGCGPCPACGGTGRVLDGTYEFVGDTVRLLSGPEWTTARLRGLATLLHDLSHHVIQHKDVKPENVLGRLAEAEPTLAAQIKPKSSAEFAAWLTLLLMVVQALLGLGEPRTVSDKDLEKIIRAVMEQQQPPQVTPRADRSRRPPPPPKKRRATAKKPGKRR